MAEGSRLRIGGDGMSLTERVLWHLGWHPRLGLFVAVCLASLGWLIVRNPFGVLLALFVLWPQFKAVQLINSQAKQLLEQARSRAVAGVAQSFGIKRDETQCYVFTAPRGSAPLGIRTPPELCATIVFLCDTFLAVSPEVLYSLASLTMEIPAGGEEVYYRYIAGVDHRLPMLQVHLSNGRTCQFRVTTDESGPFLSALRSKLRGVGLTASAVTQSSVIRPPESDKATSRDLLGTSPTFGTEPGAALPGSNERREESDEARFCYLRSSKLHQLYADEKVLDALLDQLQVPGKLAVLQRLSEQEKREQIEAQIDHFRRTPTSIWYGVPRLEVMAASIWRCWPEDLPRKLVLEHFCGVGREEDLLRPVAKWLRSQGYEPYMEVPLGRRVADVLGHRKAGVFGSDQLLAIELKNEDEQFRRAPDQLATFAEYTNAAYLACTPAAAADYLERNAESRGATVQHWDPDLLGRRLRQGGFGLLIVEREAVYEVLKPTLRTPSRDTMASVVSSLSPVMRIEC